MPPRPPLTAAVRARYILYAAAVTVFVLLLVDGALRWLEARGTLDLSSPNERVWRDTGAPWVLDGDRWVANPASDNRVLDHPFRATKGDAFRVFFVGESFLRGVPYLDTGTVHAWFREALSERTDRTLEVVNGSMSAVNSDVVRRNVRHALKHAPDLLVVQACNNEGTLPPSEVTRRLHELGTFRALRRVLRDDEPAPTYTPQDPDVTQVREHFRANLAGMLDAAAEAKVPVVLLVSPLNRRYDGNESGLPLPGRRWDQRVPVAVPCVQTGQALFESGDMRGAIDTLASCDDVEALRWTGLAEFALGQHDRARRTLEQYAEHVPRNRCRPSFQEVVRSVGQGRPGVVVVDLDATMSRLAPHGVTGPELFTDYCHLRWDAQAHAADAILDAAVAAGFLPSLRPAAGAPWPRRRALVEQAERAGTLFPPTR